ncbi:MAG: hypothetical protein C4306_08980, partial [Thermoleophilia bacterium]
MDRDPQPEDRRCLAPLRARPACASVAQLEAACEPFCERVNVRPYCIARCLPAAMLLEERERPRPLPAVLLTLCFGDTRRASWQSTISVGGG